MLPHFDVVLAMHMLSNPDICSRQVDNPEKDQ